MNTYWNRILQLISNLSSFSIFFRHKRQSWWSSLHAQVGICPIGEADFCTTKRRHLPLHGQKLSGDQRSKGVYHPCELPSDIFHSSWFFCTRNYCLLFWTRLSPRAMYAAASLRKKTQKVNKWTTYWTNVNLDFIYNLLISLKWRVIIGKNPWQKSRNFITMILLIMSLAGKGIE